MTIFGRGRGIIKLRQTNAGSFVMTEWFVEAGGVSLD